MAEFVGQNPKEHTGTISASFFPDVSIADFQAKYRYLDNADIKVIENALSDAVIEVEYGLLSLTSSFDDWDQFTQNHQLDTPAIESLYQRGVFNFAMAHILTTEITTNDTKNAKDRESNLADRIDAHNTSARQAISMLSSDRVMHVEVV